MFELYKKVNKSIEYPKGARQILEGENPFEDGPCLLCISAQNQANRSIFGLTKMGARMARVRVKGDIGARIPLDEIPVSFLSIKPDAQREKEEDNIKRFIDTYIRPLILDKNGLPKTKEGVTKSFRNINIMTNCNGTTRAIEILKSTEQILRDLNYSENDINEILSQVSLLAFQTEMDLSECKASVIDFHNVNDTEVEINSNNISDEMLDRNEASKNGESVEKSGNRIEVLISGEDSHQVREYLESGEAMPAIVYSIVTSVLENSIENSQNKSKRRPLSIEELFGKARSIIDRINQGEKKEDLIQKIDELLEYGGQITRLTDRELRLIEEQEATVDEFDKTALDLQRSSTSEEKMRTRMEGMLQTAKVECSEGTYLRILQAYGWQFNSEEREKAAKTKSDKEIIEEQKAKVTRLQAMLERTLEFADKVRKSVFGKMLFGRAIKELPEPKNIVER